MVAGSYCHCPKPHVAIQRQALSAAPASHGFLRNRGTVLELQSMLDHATMDAVRIHAFMARVDLAEAKVLASPAENWQFHSEIV